MWRRRNWPRWRRDRWVWHRSEDDSDDDDRHATEYRMGAVATVRYEYEPVVPLTAEDRTEIAASLERSKALPRRKLAGRTGELTMNLE